MPANSGQESTAVAVAVYAELIYTVMSASCSSPQTAELNASKRAETLMKWVYIGLAQGIEFGVLGALLDKRRWPPVLGAVIAMVQLYWQYRYALNSGLDRPGPATEQY